VTLRQKQKVAVLFTKVSTLTPKNFQPPAPGAPMGRSSPNYLVPVPVVCSILSQNFTPIAPSCVEISSTVQTNKKNNNKNKKTKSKLNITPNATLYGEIKTLYFTHMRRSPQWMDWYQIWFRGSSRGRNQLCGILLQSAHGFRFCEGSKFAISH